MKVTLNPKITPFSLEPTLQCGQLFRWEKINEWWYGVVQGKILKIKQVGSELLFEGVDEAFLKSYLRLDDNLLLILSQIGRDEHIKRAIQKFYGLRIVRQEPWECLISYMCSTYKNIPAIKKAILNLSKRFGQKKTLDGYEFYTFPDSQELAQASLKELEECKLGFRTKHVLQVSTIVASGEFYLESLKRLDYENAKKRLMMLPGVGHKVADCVLLFSLDKLEAFPVDVWIKRLILTYYKDNFEHLFIQRVLNKSGLSDSDYSRIGSFGRRYFGAYAGYAQEYLFHFGRQLSTLSLPLKTRA